MFDPKSFLYLLFGVSLCSQFIASSEAQKAGEKISIAVIPMGTSHVYWKAVEAGARQAAKELGIDMTWKGPLKENDRAQQIAIVEQFVSENKSGIVIAPLDDTALKRPIDAAMAKKIPVVIIDSSLKGEPGTDFVSFVATDNHAGGKMAAEELLRLLDGKGKVILLRGQEGTASTTAREEGFLEEIKKHPDIQILLDNRYAGNTAAEAQTTAMNLMDKIRQADGMFCPNEGTTFGTLLALRQAGLAGKIKLVGFDTSPALIEGIKKGEIKAVVAQHPKKMAYDGVKILVAKIRGENVPQKEDSGAVLITAENLNTPEIQALLAP
jgi:ribose transport system substrate-binding protein